MRDLTPLLAPRTVALVGASDDQNILRGRILNVMRQHAFDGQLFPVSRSCEVVQGLQAYPSVDACPEPVDLAILIIPANAIADAMRHCGQAGVKAVLVLASGFAEEPSAAGDALQAELLAIADSYGMVVSGPNTEGFSNMGAKLCATFSPTMELDATPLVPDWRTDGHVAVVAQSGGVGYSFFDRGRPKELPFSYVVTTGNEAMVESLHVVDHLIDDAATGVILIFMEDVKSPELLRPVAEKALRAGKPLIVTKIGRSEAGVRAAQSHTAAIAGDDTTYRALFRRYGILEGRDQDHMVDLAQGFSAYAGRLPAGKRVGIFTASGGGGGWLADACSDAGLTVPELDVATRAAIDVHLPPYGTSQNPVDATAQTIRQRGYAEMCELIAGSPEVDAVLAVTSARNPAGWERERETLLRVGRETEKPILLWAYTLPHPSVRELVSRAGLPLFENLRNCAETAAAMADYMAFRGDFLAPTSVKESPPRPSVADILAGPTPIVCEVDARRALAPYGICSEGTALATSAEEAVVAAALIERPVVLKVQSPNIPHKTEAGAVAVGVKGGPEVTAAFERIVASARAYDTAADIQSVLVQPLAEDGLDVILGIHRDAQFGPMLMLGLGGVFVEVLDDVAFAPVPVDRKMAQSMIDDLRGVALFVGARGAPPADRDALVDIMIRLSQFAADHVDRIDEIDLNPVRVHAQGDGVTVLDALIVKRSAP